MLGVSCKLETRRQLNVEVLLGEQWTQTEADNGARTRQQISAHARTELYIVHSGKQAADRSES